MIFIRSIFYDDGAVSETLGYILLFGIALTAIAIILLVGNSIIDNEKSKDNFQNMVQSFDIIQSNMKQVALDGTPVKTTMIHMDGGSFGINTDTSRLQVEVDGVTVYDNKTGQFIFVKENDMTNNVSIENGGVWKTSGSYSNLVSQPRFYVAPQTDTLFLNVYRLNADNTSIGNAGTGTMSIGMSYNDKSSVLPAWTVTTNHVTITMDTNYAQAWEEYLGNAVAGDVHVTCVNTPSGFIATFTGVKSVMISEHWVDVSLSGLYT